MIEDRIIKEYNKAFNRYGEDRRSILWTKDKQDMRFQILLGEELKKSRMSILDYGAGFADLNFFLKKQFYNLDYHGCDINKKFVEISQKRFPNADIFHINHVDDVKDHFDIILISGTFNVLCLNNQENMENYVFYHLCKLFSKTNYMLSVNFLSHLTDYNYKYKEHFYIDPTRLYEFAIKEMTHRIQIDSYSLPYELTFKFYKNTSIDYSMTTYKED